MLLRIVIALFVITNLISCSKEGMSRPYGYLNLRVEGQEEDIKWESITAKWIDTLGTADMEATSYYFDRCTINLKNFINTGVLQPTVIQFYYTDGLDFRPYSVSGTLTITQADNKAVRGIFNLYFDNDYNGASGRSVTGDFGIINKLY